MAKKAEDEAELDRLSREPWTRQEHSDLIKCLQLWPPDAKSRNGGYLVNQEFVKGDRWDAVTRQHNFPVLTAKQKMTLESKRNPAARLFGKKIKDPIRIRNRSRESILAQMEQLYAIEQDSCIDLLAQEKLILRAESLFESCSCSDAKRASQQDRRENGVCDPTLSYGEVEIAEFGKLLQRVQKIYGHCSSLKGKFYDIGSGVGKAVLLAAMFHGFELCCGIETVNGLHVIAEDKLSRDYVEKTIPMYSSEEKDERSHTKIRFIWADALEEDHWQEASVVFAHASAFSGSMMRRFAQICELLGSGSLVITCTRPMPESALTRGLFLGLFKDRMATSWGVVKVFVYEKLSPPDKHELNRGRNVRL